MKLIAEQVHYLRKRKEELEGRKEEYRNYCKSRESAGLDSIGAPHYVDFNDEVAYSKSAQEREKIDRVLASAEYITDRNYEIIDIGTGFYTDFGDGELDRTVLTDSGEIIVGGQGIFVSKESDFGKAVLGHKAGDEVVYKVEATGRTIKATIKEIDTIKENYMKFIKETPISVRMSSIAKKELRELKDNNREEYHKRHAITPSQVSLIKEELGKPSISNRAALNKILNDSIVTVPADSESVQIGSIVDLTLMDENGEVKPLHFELINRAVSTEIDEDYVERISPLGTAIYGLKRGDTFTVRRKHKESLKGIIEDIDNTKNVVRRVR